MNITTRPINMNKRRIFILLLLSAVIGLMAQTPSENYVRVRTYLSSDSSQWRDKVIYYDAMGREEQSIQVGASLNGGDIVMLKEYDAYGRLSKTWSPAAVSSNSGSLVDVQTLKNCAVLSNDNDSEPYSETMYESSPLNRPVKQFGPGSDWHVHDKAVTTSYLLNVEGSPSLDCRHYTAAQNSLHLSVTNHGSWPSGSLDVNCSMDEDGHTHYEFRDRNGQVVLSRQQTDYGYADTYLVRDEWGNIQAVLPPLASSAMSAPNAEWSTDDDLLRKYAYVYIYDSRYRQIAKRLPGCQWVYTVYDRSDTPVFTQDGNLREQGLWRYVLTDAWGRPCQTGTCTNTFNIWSDPLPNAVVANRTSAGYTVNGVTLSNAVIMSETFYDHYDNIPGNSLSYDSGSGYDERDANNPVGMPTATRVLLLDDSSTYLYGKTFYDYRGNVVQSKSTNHLGGTDSDYASYDFTGNATARKHIHTATGQTTRTEQYTYEYDLWGRMTKETHQLGNATAVVINKNTYDGIGRLQHVSHGNLSNAGLSYTYNVRSWLTGISSPLFSQTLYYNNPYADNSSYSGNVSRMTWRTSSTPYQGTSHSYDYYYDRQNRLTEARYDKLENPGGHYDVSFQYDEHGNVTSIDRYDKDENGNRTKADEVTLSYNGNQLCGLDVFDPYVGTNTHVQYNGNTNGETEYEYDGNGNMTKDVHHNISSVEYNLLNLPRQITFSDGSVTRYTYDATGRKMRVEYGTQTVPLAQPWTRQVEYQPTEGQRTAAITVTSTTDYVGNYVYNNGSQWYLTLDCGEVSLTGSTSASSYYYDLKDYQGNVRMAVKSGSSSHFMTDYYPYGGVIRKGRIGTHHRLFIGKELDKMHGLNWYDFGARMYDPTLGRFMTMDPLAEKYYPYSPYNYCLDNPVKNIDPDGRAVETGWDVFNVGLDIASLSHNVINGNVGAAVVDGLCLVADVAATAMPFVPGGAGAAVKATRTAEKAVNATKSVGKSAETAKMAQLRQKAEIGQEAHRQIEKELTDAFGSRTEVKVNLHDRTVRKDAQMPDGKYVIIKPDTKSGHKAAKSRQRLMEKNGKEAITIYYDPKNPAYLPGSPSYIGAKKK